MGLFYPKIFTTYFCGSLTLKMVDLTLIFKSMSKWPRKWLFFSFFENGRFTSRFTIGFGLKKFAATLDVKCLLLRVFRGIYFESYFILSECEFRILISVSSSFQFQLNSRVTRSCSCVLELYPDVTHFRFWCFQHHLNFLISIQTNLKFNFHPIYGSMYVSSSSNYTHYHVWKLKLLECQPLI